MNIADIPTSIWLFSFEGVIYHVNHLRSERTGVDSHPNLQFQIAGIPTAYSQYLPQTSLCHPVWELGNTFPGLLSTCRSSPLKALSAWSRALRRSRCLQRHLVRLRRHRMLGQVDLWRCFENCSFKTVIRHPRSFCQTQSLGSLD